MGDHIVNLRLSDDRSSLKTPFEFKIVIIKAEDEESENDEKKGTADEESI